MGGRGGGGEERREILKRRGEGGEKEGIVKTTLTLHIQSRLLIMF